MIRRLNKAFVKAHKPNMMWSNMNVTSVIIKQFKNEIPTHINRVNMNESNIILTSVIKNYKINVQTMVPNRLKLYLNVIVSWWFLLSLHFKKITSFGRVLSPHRPWQECSNVNSVISDHEATQKYLLSTHKYVGTRFKCNQCDQLAIQWCNLKSHKQSKCIKYQCGQCHYKPYKRNYLKSPAQLKNNDRDNFKDWKQVPNS